MERSHALRGFVVEKEGFVLLRHVDAPHFPPPQSILTTRNSFDQELILKANFVCFKV
jgi:hypothetical protein